MRLGSQSGESLLVVDGEGSGLTLGVATSSASCGTSGRSFTSVATSSTSGTASSVTSVTSFTGRRRSESAFVFEVDLFLLGASFLLGGGDLFLLWREERC